MSNPKPSELRVGLRVGRLVLLRKVKGRLWATWECKCDCGETPLVRTVDLTRGYQKSCGCLFRDWRAGRVHRVRFPYPKEQRPQWRAWLSWRRRVVRRLGLDSGEGREQEVVYRRAVKSEPSRTPWPQSECVYSYAEFVKVAGLPEGEVSDWAIGVHADGKPYWKPVARRKKPTPRATPRPKPLPPSDPEPDRHGDPDFDD